VKFKLFEMPTEKIIMKGNERRIESRSLSESLQAIFDQVGQEVDIIAHRVVHGAEQFKASVPIDDEVVQQIEAISYLAPLHNPINLEGIKLARLHYGDKPQMAVFDTSFHQTMPPTSYLYAL